MQADNKSLGALALILFCSMTASSCGAASSLPPTNPPADTITSPAPPRPTPPGTKYDVGGYNLYIECAGIGNTTVIFESGLEGDVVTWKTVFPEVAKFTRACRYDRAGLAHSDYGPVPRDAELAAKDLHILLNAANIQPPYILVGHSFGGLLIRRFANDFPNEVTGMIFVDSLNENWWEDALALLPPPSEMDSARLKNFRLYLTDGWRDPSNNFEKMNIPAVVEQVRQTGSIGDIPVTVLTADRFTVLNSGLPPDLETALADLFKDEQSRLLSLSTQGIQIIVPDTGHNIPRENPIIVVNAIQNMLK